MSIAGLLLSLATAQAGAQPAVPRGAVVPIDDYPPAALRAEEQGDTGFHLRIDTAGRVIECTVTKGSGSAVLDAATCRLALRRARFSPARDAGGAAVEGSYDGVVRWRLP
jgi:periplasmic protein TonB